MILLWTEFCDFIILTTMVVNIINNLKSLGFSEYEARIYGGLAENHPATPYEAAKIAGIPTSKVYEVLAKLAEKGLVLEVGSPERRQYIPLDPEEFVRRERQSLGGVLDRLETEFAGLRQEKPVAYLWSLTSLEEFKLRASQLISGAKKTLLVSLWEEDSELISSPHSQAMARGVKGASVVFGETRPIELGTVYRHPIRDTIYQERGGRGFVLVADSCEVLWGSFLGDTLQGVWSRNPGFVTLAEDYVKHDIYIMKLVQRYGGDLLRRFGPGYELLRDVFTNEEIKEIKRKN